MAIVTFGTEDVVRDIAFQLAVIAKYFDNFVAKLFWHWGVFNFCVKLAIVNPHVAETFEAQRTLIFVLTQVFKTFFVHSVTASGQPHTFISRPK